MQNVIIEEPYEFIPPGRSEWWPRLVQWLLKPYLRKKFGVHSVECREVQRLQDSLDAGQGVLLAPNHCRLSDPLTLGYLARAIRRNMHAMASWHLFKQDWFTTFMTRSVGAFSVYREGVDRQAINTAVDILVEGRRPLVVFAEGAISRHNDQLMPLMDGTSFIARTAAKRREKNSAAAGVVVHPVAIRYYFQGDLQASIMPVIEEIESHFSWYPQRDRTLIQRLRQIGQALLSLKEIEYFHEARTGDFYERVDGLIEDERSKLEKEYDVKDSGEGVVTRVKNLRTVILPDMVHNNVSAEERHRRWKQLAACYYVQQMSHYPRKYVRTSEPNIVEHILETVERFEEDFTDKITVHSPFHAVIEVGTAIEVTSRRDRKANTDPVMEGIRTQLTEMLARLSAEARKI
ncbi:MAG: 1-acyl-sn-glycerol-3-phosphate acyltransferase [Pirellulales bacterium]|nr:1-acyl-sn-glycerol-3-phosphate acyltransferase [Pirellulales bacterium]